LPITYFTDNNEGFTIIDVTDPKDISICFAFLEQMKPLSPDQYMRAYSEPGSNVFHEEEGAISFSRY
jgi:hypothetical protein